MNINDVKLLQAVGYRLVQGKQGLMFCRPDDRRPVKWIDGEIILNNNKYKVMYPNVYRKDIEDAKKQQEAKTVKRPCPMGNTTKTENHARLAVADSPANNLYITFDRQLAGVDPLDYRAATWAIAKLRGKVSFEIADTTIETLRNAVSACERGNINIDKIKKEYVLKCKE